MIGQEVELQLLPNISSQLRLYVFNYLFTENVGYVIYTVNRHWDDARVVIILVEGKGTPFFDTWESRHLKSPVTSFFVQQVFQTNSKSTKFGITDPLRKLEKRKAFTCMSSQYDQYLDTFFNQWCHIVLAVSPICMVFDALFISECSVNLYILRISWHFQCSGEGFFSKHTRWLYRKLSSTNWICHSWAKGLIVRQWNLSLSEEENTVMLIHLIYLTWWCHDMETYSLILATWWKFTVHRSSVICLHRGPVMRSCYGVWQRDCLRNYLFMLTTKQLF